MSLAIEHQPASNLLPGGAEPNESGSRSPAVLKAALSLVEKRLATNPSSAALLAGLLFERGTLLERVGRSAEAGECRLQLLELEPGHHGALNSLGGLLMAAGETAEARRVYCEAVERYPDDPIGLVSLANLLMQEGEMEGARGYLEHALEVDPRCRAAEAGLSFVLAESGDPERALKYRRAAFQGRCVVPGRYRGEGPPVTVLKLISTNGGNLRTEGLLSDLVFETHLVATEFYDRTTVLPPHRLIVNAIGDADIAAAALAGAESLLERSAAPVINSPLAVAATRRCDVARRLAAIPGVVAPRTQLFSRESLAAANGEAALRRAGFEFPLLVRTPGFHGGEHFLRVEAAGGLGAALAALPGGELNAIQFLDARRADGKTRKYRAMMIDGRLYPLHAAISAQWKVHYFSADMEQRAEHRAEEAEFLADMPGVVGAPAMAALEAIQRALGLDYGGIDFGLNQAGQVLLFEANATMAIFPPGEDRRWDYRRPAVQRILRAVRTMLIERARPAPV